MTKIILITGATDGIGFEAAKLLVDEGHHVLLHGRSEEKLQKISAELSKRGKVETYMADLSDLDAVKELIKDISNKHNKLDVLINNAGVLKAQNTITKEGYDIRFVVNTIAPYLLTNSLLPLLGDHGRVVNVSSSAQTPVNIYALKGNTDEMDALEAYSQSKLAIIMWSKAMADSLGNKGPMIVTLNPGSLLGTKMVKEAFSIAGKDLSIGANILVRAAVSNEFADASGKYFDNDSGSFANPHADTMDIKKVNQVVGAIEKVIGKYE